MKLLIAIVIGATLAVLGQAAPAPCELYTTCVDCACNTLDYDVTSACMAGCAWLPASGLCVSNSSAAAARAATKYTSLWSVDGIEESFSSANTRSASMQDQREQMVENGQTTCDVPRGAGTIFTVVVFLVTACIFQVIIAVGTARTHKQLRVTAEEDRVWLLETLRNHVQEGDAAVWETVATRPVGEMPKFSAYVAIALFIFLPLTVPSIVWLAIGLPYSVSSDWQFAFYYPICFVGGLGFLASVAISAPITCDTKPALTKAYAITNNHVLIVTADPKKRELTGTGSGVKSIAMESVACCERSGSTVTFQVLQAGAGRTNKVPIKFTNLSVDAAPQLFALLQRMRPGQDAVTATAVASGDIPANSMTNNAKVELSPAAPTTATSATSIELIERPARTAANGYSMVV